jgi:hypothetical protein
MNLINLGKVGEASMIVVEIVLSSQFNRLTTIMTKERIFIRIIIIIIKQVLN